MTTPITTVIVDDEPPARRTLRLLLDRQSDIRIAGECADGPAAVELITRTAPDLVFLDVQIPGADGFEVLRRLGSSVRSVVVFVTAYDHYAVRAFEAHAVDYLLKPFSDRRFDDVLDRARRALRHRNLEDFERRWAALLNDAAGGVVAAPGQLVVRDGNRTLVLPWREIEWVEADDYYSRIHAGPRRPLIRRTLRWLQSALDSRFVRIHRSAIVNLDHVREVRMTASGEHQVVLANGATVRVSRTYRDELLKRLQSTEA
jgi:two-component system, LytTR family, response regulator